MASKSHKRGKSSDAQPEGRQGTGFVIALVAVVCAELQGGTHTQQHQHLIVLFAILYAPGTLLYIWGAEGADNKC